MKMVSSIKSRNPNWEKFFVSNGFPQKILTIRLPLIPISMLSLIFKERFPNRKDTMVVNDFLTASGLLLGFMTLGFFLSKRIRLTSIIDVLWPLGPLFMAFYLFFPGPYSLEKLLLLFCLLVWSLRLSLFLFWTRILKKDEDRRYQEILPKKESRKKDLLAFLQFLFQGFLQILISLSFLPFYWSQEAPSSSLLWISGFFAIASIIGEAMADGEVLRFKRMKLEGILKSGLWKYSRHPNYLFDWLFWVSLGFMGLSLPWGGLSFTGALLMWIIFNYLTGPLTERLSLKKHKDLYLNYQKETPFMIPKLSLFRKNQKTV